MSRRTIIIALVLSIIALLIGMYFAWTRSRRAVPPPSTIVIVPDEIPERVGLLEKAAPGVTLQLLSDNAAAGYWLVSDEKAMPKKSAAQAAPPQGASTATSTVFYIDPEGQVFEAKPGKDTLITSLPVKDIVNVWGGERGAVLVKYGSEIDPKFGVYTSPANKWESLSNVSSAALSADNTRVAYLNLNGEIGTIAMTARGVGRKTALASYNIEDFNVILAGRDAILLVPKPAALYGDDSVWKFEISSRTVRPFLASARGVMMEWSPDGLFGLISGTNDANDAYFRTISAQGGSMGDINRITLPDKCGITGDMLYCGVPMFSNNANTSIMPDAYLRREAHFSDEIYKIDIKKNTADFLFSGSLQNPIDVLRPQFKDDNLYLINRRDQKLYRLIFGG